AAVAHEIASPRASGGGRRDPIDRQREARPEEGPLERSRAAVSIFVADGPEYHARLELQAQPERAIEARLDAPFKACPPRPRVGAARHRVDRADAAQVKEREGRRRADRDAERAREPTPRVHAHAHVEPPERPERRRPVEPRAREAPAGPEPPEPE